MYKGDPLSDQSQMRVAHMRNKKRLLLLAKNALSKRAYFILEFDES